jgi:hypothetical protein
MTVKTLNQTYGFQSFRVPRIIVENGGLKKLSGDAIRVFLHVSFRCYRRQAPQVQFSYIELERELDMTRAEITDAIDELQKNQVLHHVIDSNLINFYLVKPDNSRVQSYGANIAQTKIEVGPVSERQATSATNSPQQ